MNPVHGVLDAVAHTVMGRYTAARAPRGHFSRCAHCGHALFLEAPDCFDRALAQLVKETNP